MVEKTGLTASGRLHQMALESHLRKMFKKSGRITPAQVKGSIKKMSALFAKSLLQRSSGPFGLSQLQERRASILSSNSFPRALNEVGMGGPGLDNTNDPYLQSLRLPSDPSLAPNNEVNNWGLSYTFNFYHMLQCFYYNVPCIIMYSNTYSESSSNSRSYITALHCGSKTWASFCITV